MRTRFKAWKQLLVLLSLLPCRLVVLGATLTSGPRVDVSTNLATAAVTATIQWSTDVPTRGRLLWGPAPANLRFRADGPITNSHHFRLEGLTRDQRFHFTVGTARQTLATNSFWTGAAPEPPALGPPPPPPTPAHTPGTNTTTPSSPRAPPTSETWGNMATLADHFERHGPDFAARNADDYARMAWEFLQRAQREGLPMKLDSQGVLRAFDPKTRAFGAYNRNGTTRTFFKPRSRDYFDRQPGRPVPASPSNRRAPAPSPPDRDRAR